MDSSITANDVTKAKQVVLKSAMGLCGLNDADFFQRLEELYWTAFKDGFEKQRLIDIK